MKKMFLLLAMCLYISCGLYAAPADSSLLVVTTTHGKIQGTYENDISVWRGVHYAKPPVGALRFRDPQPLDNWTGIQKTTEYGAICPQMRRAMREVQPQNEDCLFLNVWSPAADGKKRPVMFWVHGGGFLAGSGSANLYDGAELAKNGDVVVVTINYRLGPLGFLYFKDLKGGNEFDNNLGIKDQVAALKWVKENIAAFGGDPDAVTIFGESAGGVSVLTLMTLPSAKGLFGKVIAESGPPDDLWTPQIATDITKRYLAILHISPDSISRLRAVPVDTLSSALEVLMHELISKPSLIKTFAPTIDGSYIPTGLLDAVKQGRADNIPLLIGTNRNEANLFAMKRLNMAPKSAKELAPYMTKIKPETRNAILATYKNYPHRSGVLDLMTDGIFTVPTIRLASEQSKHSATYMYRFDWCSTPLKMVGLRACHGLEIPFVFGTFRSGTGKMLSTMANKKVIARVSKQIQTAWLSFVRTGNPGAQQLANWKKYDAAEHPTLIFDKTTTLATDPNGLQRKAWADVNIFE
jgi:para-nitrobenzyl esterase